MAYPFQKPVVAVCGSGALARYIIDAILRTERWDVIVLSRCPPQNLPCPAIAVDYSNLRSLNKALRGVHTVISTIPDDTAQLYLIEACIQSGVVRFAPSEFEGSPARRPLFSASGYNKINVLKRLDEVRDHLQSTSFVCGMFYEYFVPGGWRACGGGGWDTGSFLVDLKRKTATIPSSYHDSGLNTAVCMTSAEDVGIFVSKALELEWWPAELRMWGERLRLGDIIKIAEHVRNRRFQVKLLSEDALEDRMEDAICNGDFNGQQRVQAMQAIAQEESCFGIQPGQHDYIRSNLNTMFPEVRPESLESFLKRFWKPSTSQ